MENGKWRMENVVYHLFTSFNDNFDNYLSMLVQ